jgi:hypothetical protein
MINSTTTNATSTNFAVTTLCLTGDTCRTTWPTGGSSNWTDAGIYLTPLTTSDGILISSASSTITNLVMVNATSTNATTTGMLAITGGRLDFAQAIATTTIKTNSPFAWTIATTTGGGASSTLFRIDTTNGAEQVIVGGGYGLSDVIIGAVGTTTNLVFEESATIHGQGTNTLTFGTAGDKINFAVNTGFGSTTPWRTLSVTGTVGFDGLTATSTPGDSLCLSNLKEVTLRTANTCSAASSIRFKQNVVTLDTLPDGLLETSKLQNTPAIVASGGLAEIMALRPVSYSYTPEYLGGFVTNPNWNGERVGFIAEEVQQIDPRLVTIDSLGQPDTVRYEHLTAVLTKATQELSLRLDAVASTTATTTSDSELFAQGFFGNLFTRVTGWFADVTNGIGDLFANTFRAKEKICVDDQCLTKEDIRTLLQMKNGQLVPSPPPPAPESPPEVTPEPLPEPVPEPEPEATSTPEEIIPTPEPESEATSTPEVVPIPEPIPAPEPTIEIAPAPTP